MSDLRTWWIDQATSEIDQSIPKIIDYGSTDLIWVGRQMAATMGRDVEDDEAAELGIFFYLVGKIGRWASAVTEGRRPTDDTVFDTHYYAKMVLRIREAGEWPGDIS